MKSVLTNVLNNFRPQRATKLGTRSKRRPNTCRNGRIDLHDMIDVGQVYMEKTAEDERIGQDSRR